MLFNFTDSKETNLKYHTTTFGDTCGVGRGLVVMLMTVFGRDSFWKYVATPKSFDQKMSKDHSSKIVLYAQHKN